MVADRFVECCRLWGLEGEAEPHRALALGQTSAREEVEEFNAYSERYGLTCECHKVSNRNASRSRKCDVTLNRRGGWRQSDLAHLG